MQTGAHEIGSAASHYQILAKLAVGGMADIFLARGAGVAGVARHVVLKRVLRERASDFEFLRMFLDEARLAAQLQHPNIAQVYDVGKLGDSYFFTMEYVHGETVRTLFQRAQSTGKPPPLGCVLAIGSGAAAGLQHAHERIGIDGRPLGIVHRDVSPSNLMVSFEGNVKLVDFGVAKAADRVHETRSGAIKGKIHYLSPEQAAGHEVDRRSDVFSLGIVMWELITMQRLYKRHGDFEAMRAIISDPPPPPSSVRAGVPPQLDALVLRALAKQPAQRWQTTQDMLDAFDGVAASTGTVASPAVLSRYMRELFGPRSEPWLALAQRDAPAEVVTVTVEPIPKDISVVQASPIDRQLASVIDLSVAKDDADSSDSVGHAPLSIPNRHAPRWFVPALILVPALVIALGIAVSAYVATPLRMERPRAPAAATLPPPAVVTVDAAVPEPPPAVAVPEPPPAAAVEPPIVAVPAPPAEPPHPGPVKKKPARERPRHRTPSQPTKLESEPSCTTPGECQF